MRPDVCDGVKLLPAKQNVDETPTRRRLPTKAFREMESPELSGRLTARAVRVRFNAPWRYVILLEGV